MPSSLGYFDDIARIGDAILGSIAGPRRNPASAPYLHVLGEVYDTLAHLHGLVLDVAARVGASPTHEEAARALQSLHGGALRAVLKSQEMCDELGRLGSRLQSEQSLSPEDQAAWDELRSQLENREAGTAMLYDEKLRELRDAPAHVPELDALKRMVKQAADQLVVQKARFEWLATRARAELSR